MAQENYTVTEIGKRNLNAENRWELLDLNNLEFNKPTVLCLSGNGTIRNEHANGFVKEIYALLDLKFKTKQSRDTLEHIDIMGVKYADSGLAGGKLTELALEQLTNALLKLLVDKKGHKLELNQAKQNMSRISYVTFSAGNSILNQIIKNLNQKMLKVGYLQDEIIAINNATMEVSFAPENNVDNQIPSVHFISLKDKVVGKKQLSTLIEGGVLSTEQAHHLNGIYLHQDVPGFLYGVERKNSASAGSIQVISSGLLNTDGKRNSYNDIDEHEIALIDRDEDWSLKPTIINGVSYQSSNADCVSQMMAWAICCAVDNSCQNFVSNHYVPNTYQQELINDFQSIIKSFGQTKLAKKPIPERTLSKPDIEKLTTQNLSQAIELGR